MARRRPLFATHPLFLMLWSCAFVSNIGNWMENSAQNWAVVAQLEGQPTRQAFLSEILNVADFAPAIVLTLFAGVLADRMDSRRLLLTLQMSACLLGAGLAAAAWMHLATPWVVIAFTFAEGIVWALNTTPWQVTLTRIVGREDLPRAVALNSAQFNLARLIGPFVAGLLILRFGIPAAFTLNALSFLPVIFALTRLPAPSPQPARLQAESKPPFFKDLFAGLRITFAHPGLRRLAIMSALFMFLSAPLQGLLAAYTQQSLHGTSRLYGILLGAIGLGATLGAVVIGRIPSYYPRHHLIPLGMTVTSGFIVLFTFTHHAPGAFAVLVIVGFFWMISLNSTNAANQLLATDENRGRVISVMLLFNQGSTPLGHLAAAALTHVTSAPNVIRMMVTLSACCSLYFLFKREPAIDPGLPTGPQPTTPFASLWEALTAQSHRPIPEPVRETIAESPASTNPESAPRAS